MDDYSFTFASGSQATCTLVVGSLENAEDVYAASLLAAAIQEVARVRPPIVATGQEPPGQDRVLVGSPHTHPGVRRLLRTRRVLGVPEDLDAEVANLQLLLPDDLGAQGFVIYLARENDRRSLVLAGHTSQGTLYAVNTVISRLFRRGPHVLMDRLGTRLLPIVHRSPFEVRSVFTNLGGPDWLGPGQWAREWGKDGGYDYEGFVDWLTSHKINHLLLALFDLEFGIAYPSQRFPVLVNPYHPNVQHEFMGDLIEYAHRRHIQVFFHADFPDNWSSVVRAYPELAGANVDKTLLMDEATWRDYQQHSTGWRKNRRGASWVCGSKPRVLEIWRAYWEELLGRYPDVDGAGGQPCEHPDTRCNCADCRETFFDQERRFFGEVFRIARAKNPRSQPWIFRVWGGRQMVRPPDAISDLAVIDWWATFPRFLTRSYLPRSNWYLYHRMTEEWPEFGFQQVARAFAQSGVTAFQIRGVKYRETDHLYQAFEEFSWNPDLAVEDYASLYVLKRFRREDPELAAAYAHWIKATGYAELLADPDVPDAWLEEDDYRGKLRAEVAQLSPRLAEIGVPPEFIESAVRAAAAETLTRADLAWTWRVA